MICQMCDDIGKVYGPHPAGTGSILSWCPACAGTAPEKWKRYQERMTQTTAQMGDVALPST